MIVPTPTQIAFLRHLVTSGKPWQNKQPGPRFMGRPGEPDGQYRLPSGLAVRDTTVRKVVEYRWLLILGQLGKPSALGVITPAGRLALAEAEPDLPSGWDDLDRVRLREPGLAALCRGPIEVEECEHHPGELEAYRWTWSRPSDPSIPANHAAYLEAGEPEVVQRCPLCQVAHEAEFSAELRAAMGAGR